ncbi:asparagine synthase (glutamine-hydrolyzing) [Fundidesulfovibrio agrisoli]|uniref:asparagine synthase (glutamine-hydrolyzing) n=1 Tax=Fundidesulfovibrio agrisoli TaxID=2922717 RepID=UPI002434CEE5|nr:asparagine synthase (glutamine-hydrolyzing) [Fundidesulfovibrio agrisoli]
MCGIAGFTGPPAPRLLRDMCRSLTHRGPDDEGYLDHPQVSLAMRRLAIVDLSGGRQPIANEDGTVVTVFNGEIYNHAAMRRALTAAGHRFATHHCDTETVVHAYEEHGVLWPEKAQANGMFGLAIWDQARQRLLLYRDRLGKKPLYWAPIPTGIAFASEIKALLRHSDVSRELDHGSLYRYFGLKNTSAPRTAYLQIRQLPPGHCLAWTPDGGIEEPRPYWKLDFPSFPDVPDESEAAARILELLTDSVRLRMDCDVSYGAYLSGGMDSSAVTALMARFLSKPVKTFCLGYADLEGGQQEGKSRDLYFSRMMAGRLGTDHHEHIITAGDFARDFLGVMRAFDEPFSGTVSTYFLSEYMRRHITVALSGDGADELFGSYLAHRLAFPVEVWNRLKRLEGKARFEDLTAADREAIAPFDTPQQFAFLDRVAAPTLAAWRERLDVFTHAERRELLTPGFLAAAGEDVGRNPYDAIQMSLTARDALNRSLETDQRELLPNQVLPFVDRLSMAHSIEVRCPFLDHRMVAYVNSLPGSLKIRGLSTKHILRKALAGLLPQELIDRPKEGFVQPVYTWMRGPLKDFTTQAMASLPEHMFSRAAVDGLMQRFMAGDQSLNAKVWSLTCMSAWLERQS